MQIHVTRDGQALGPYTTEELSALLSAGQVAAHDMVWVQSTEWQPLSEVARELHVDAPEPAPAPDGSTAALAAAPPSRPVHDFVRDDQDQENLFSSVIGL
jgi:hypothetical protein